MPSTVSVSFAIPCAGPPLKYETGSYPWIANFSAGRLYSAMLWTGAAAVVGASAGFATEVATQTKINADREVNRCMEDTSQVSAISHPRLMQPTGSRYVGKTCKSPTVCQHNSGGGGGTP